MEASAPPPPPLRNTIQYHCILCQRTLVVVPSLARIQSGCYCAGDNREVTEFNYRLYLDLVETQLLELMSVVSDGEVVDYTPLLAKLSTFTTPRRSAGPTVNLVVTDRKIITRPCPE